MPDRYYSTREVAELLDIKPGRLSMAVWITASRHRRWGRAGVSCGPTLT